MQSGIWTDDDFDRVIICGRWEFWVRRLVGKATYPVAIDTYLEYVPGIRSIICLLMRTGPVGIAQVAHKRSIERLVPDNEPGFDT